MAYTFGMRSVSMGVEADIKKIYDAALCRAADKIAGHNGREIDRRRPETIGIFQAVSHRNGQVGGLRYIGFKKGIVVLKLYCHKESNHEYCKNKYQVYRLN
jgi:hypothetical protein